MRSLVFVRSSPKVFLALLFSALCQLVRRLKWLASTQYRQPPPPTPLAPSMAAHHLNNNNNQRQQTYCRLFSFKSLLPSCRTIALYLVTFGIVLPYISLSYGNTLYQLLLDHDRYVKKSDVIRKIARGSNMTQRIVEQNTQRLRKAIDVLDRLTLDYHNITGEIRSRNFKDVTIGIITYSRDKYREEWDTDPRQYVTQLTASLIDKFKQYRERKPYSELNWAFRARSLSIGIVLCDVDEEPDKNHEFRWLTNRVKFESVSRKKSVAYMNSCDDPARKVTGSHPHGSFEYNSKFEKQKEDYTFCLRFFQQYSMTRYVLALEDDVIPKEDFFFKLHELVFNRLDRYEYGSDVQVRKHDSYFGRPPVFMVKLQHPEVFLGFTSGDPERLAQLLAMAAFSSIVVLVASSCWQYFRVSSPQHVKKLSKPPSPEPLVPMTQTEPPTSSASRPHSHQSRLFNLVEHLFAKSDFGWFSFVKWLLYFVLVFLVIGRQNTYLPLVSALHTTLKSVPTYFQTLIRAPSCCITAVLYPKQSVSEVIDFFEQTRCVHATEARDDMLFGQFSERHPLGYPSLVVEPNLFYHIGRYSSIRGRVNTNDDREWVDIPF